MRGLGRRMGKARSGHGAAKDTGVTHATLPEKESQFHTKSRPQTNTHGHSSQKENRSHPSFMMDDIPLIRSTSPTKKIGPAMVNKTPRHPPRGRPEPERISVLFKKVMPQVTRRSPRGKTRSIRGRVQAAPGSENIRRIPPGFATV